MSNKIDLKAILAKHSPIVAAELEHNNRLPNHIMSVAVEKALVEVWNTAVDECKKSATVGHNGYDWIVKDIEKVKQMIL